MEIFKIEKHIKIDADKMKIWKVLTDPEFIKQYFFGTENISEWKRGSEIVFQGESEAKRPMIMQIKAGIMCFRK